MRLRVGERPVAPEPTVAVLNQRVNNWNQAYAQDSNRAVKQATHAFPEFSNIMSIKLRRMPADAAFAETIRKVVVGR